MHRVILLAATLLLPVFLWAGPSGARSDALQPHQSISAGLLCSSFDYQEEFAPPGKSTENGWLFGMALRYTFKGGTDIPLYARLQFDFSPSGTEYGGTETDDFGRTVDFTQNTQNWFSKTELDAGFVFHNVGNSSLDIVPYVGYGYRVWTRELASHDNLQGYREDYSCSFLPVGVKGEVAIGRRWSVGLDVAMHIMLAGSIFIDLPAYKRPTLTLGNRMGWYAALPVEYAISSSWGASGSFWYEYSAIDKSNESPHVVNGAQEVWIYEPPSRTQQFGFALAAYYRF